MKKLILFILVSFQFWNSFVAKGESFREEMAYEELYNNIGESQESIWQEKSETSEDKSFESKDNNSIVVEVEKSRIPMEGDEVVRDLFSSNQNFDNRRKESDSKSFEENLLVDSIKVIDEAENEFIGDIDTGYLISQANYLSRKASNKVDNPVKIQEKILPKYKVQYMTTPLIMNNKNKILEFSVLNKIKIYKNKEKYSNIIVRYLLILVAAYVAVFIYRKKESKYMFYK